MKALGLAVGFAVGTFVAAAAGLIGFGVGVFVAADTTVYDEWYRDQVNKTIHGDAVVTPVNDEEV